jgi:hypothetical protein
MKPENNPEAAAETAQSMGHVPARQLRNHERLAKIDLIHAAHIAATLRRNGEDEIEAVRSTYTLLDIFLYCQDSLKSEASIEAGIKRYQKGLKVDAEFYAAYAALKKADFKKATHNVGCEPAIEEQLLGPYHGDERGPDGKRKTIEFWTELEAAIPLPKSTRDKPTERMTRLKRFLKEWLQETRPEMNEEDRILEAAEQIERMKREGIEPNFSAFLKVRFPSWWAEAEARDKSIHGKKGQAVKKEKKGKQVQVKPASNKRKARPPVEKLPEAIQQFIAENKSQA